MKKYLNKTFFRQVLLVPILMELFRAVTYYAGRLFGSAFTPIDVSTALDSQIPFLPWTILIYFGCVPFWGANYVYQMLRKNRRGDRFFVGEAVGLAISLIFFSLLPTTNVRPEITGNGFFDWAMRFLYWVDAPVNLFPSVHCLLAWICWVGVRGQKDVPLWYRITCFIAGLLVFVSTLTTKQHVLLDLAGGLLAAEFGYWLAGRAKFIKWYTPRLDRLADRKL